MLSSGKPPDVESAKLLLESTKKQIDLKNQEQIDLNNESTDLSNQINLFEKQKKELEKQLEEYKKVLDDLKLLKVSELDPEVFEQHKRKVKQLELTRDSLIDSLNALKLERDADNADIETIK